MANRNKGAERRKKRVRRAVKARAAGRPRLSVFRSEKNIYAQIIDDIAGHTLVAASSLEKDIKNKVKKGSSREAAEEIGRLIAKRAKEAKIEEVVFDRGAYIYHGRVKVLAEAAREGGLKF